MAHQQRPIASAIQNARTKINSHLHWYIHSPYGAPFAFLLSVSLLLTILHMASPAIGHAFEWRTNTTTVFTGWTFFTAHLVHTNQVHLIMNMMGLWVLVGMAYPLLTMRKAVILYLLCCLAIGLTLPVSGLVSYRGLSGILYGALGWLSVASWRRPHRAILPYWVTGGMLLLLLWPDKQHDAFTANLIQARVAHMAHLAGAICGVLYGSLCRLPQNNRSTTNPSSDTSTP